LQAKTAQGTKAFLVASWSIGEAWQSKRGQASTQCTTPIYRDALGGELIEMARVFEWYSGVQNSDFSNTSQAQADSGRLSLS
jgi:hypothetical protein